MASVLGQLSKVHVNLPWIPTILQGNTPGLSWGRLPSFCSGSGSFFEGYFQLLRIFVFLSKFCVTFLAGSQLSPLIMAIRVVEFSNKGYKIRKVFA